MAGLAGRSCRRFVLILCCLVTGCAESSNLRPVAATLPSGSSALLLPGSMSMVTSHERGQGPVVCIAPSPDWAVASGSVAKLEGSGGTAAAKASLDAERARTEAITAMGGRSAGVVALRDGLYAACQAYANGIIGQDAYALIISQYSDVLIAIATGGEGAAQASPAGKPSRAVAAHPAADARASAALLVACLEEYDPTRLAGRERNELLSFRVCSNLVERLADGDRR